MSTLRKKVLTNPATRRLVFEVLKLTDQCDPLDAVRDIETVVLILDSELAAMLAEVN